MMDSGKLASAMLHRFTLNVKLIEHGFRAQNLFIERGRIHGGLTPNQFAVIVSPAFRGEPRVFDRIADMRVGAQPRR